MRKQVGPGINPEEIEKLRGRVAELQVEVDKLRRSAERSESTAAVARREVEDTKRTMAALQVQAATVPTVIASPAPEFQAGLSTAPAPATPSLPAAAQIQASPQAAAISKDGPMQMELLRHSVTSRGIVLEMMLTRLSGGDAEVYVYQPDSYPLVRLITSEGFESMRGRLTGSNGRTGDLTIAMVEGVPVRVTYLFEGKFSGPVRCSTIDLKVKEARSNEWRAFRFSDVLVSPE